MNFNSFEFGLFFVVVYAVYLSLNHRAQNRMLLAASYLFYSFWDWRFLGLILVSTLTDYLCALGIHRHGGNTAGDRTSRKRYLLLSIVINLTVLGFFKYFNFFLDNIFSFFSTCGIHLATPTWKIILPVGISFYTFQTMSYTVSVYRKQVKPTRDFLDYALYVSFFPQLVAGPIERAESLLPQIMKPRTITHENLNSGLLLIFWGLFKKIFIADNLGAFIAATSCPAAMDGMPGGGGIVLVTTYAFLFQLYCDFSAYSDIARGTARLMGFDIMVNFRAPLFAPNIQETWNRWHISLTSWIRDHLYYPLATTKIFNRFLDARLLVIITFLIMGLWHGASWNFVLWGGYNGVLLAAYVTFVLKTRRYRRPVPTPVRHVLHALSVFTTFHVIVIGVLFFRADSLSQIGVWLYHILANFTIDHSVVELFIMVLIHASPLVAADLFLDRMSGIKSFNSYPAVLRYAAIYIMFYAMVVFKAKSASFIYFQF